MKNLVIDAGNSKVKCGLFEQNQLLRTEKLGYDEVPKAIEDWVENEAVGAIYVSDVSGKLEGLLSQTPPSVPMGFLTPESKLPFHNHYQSSTLGSDRKALVTGAMELFGGMNCLIIDAGSCVTFDLLTASYDYLGGAISPGLHMRLKAMHSFTGKLPLPGWDQPSHFIGKSTEECLLSGAYFGLLAEIEFTIGRYSQEYKDLKVILTGGDASELAMNIKTSIFVDEHLLLYGLNKLLIHNAE